MTSINGGGAFHRVQNLLDQNSTRVSDSMQRLASGKEVITPGDRLSQVAISNGIRSELATLKVGFQNGTEALQAITTANQDVMQLSDMVIRLEELNALGENELNTSEDIEAIKAEARAILDEFASVQTRAKWKGNAMFHATTTAAPQVSFGQNDSGSTVVLSLGKTIPLATTTTLLGLRVETAPPAGNATLVSAQQIATGDANGASAGENSSKGLSKLKSQVDLLQINGGALYNQISNTLDHMSSLKAGYNLDISSKTDVDFAAETTNLAKGQILAQAGTAMLAQANSQGQGMLKLIQ